MPLDGRGEAERRTRGRDRARISPLLRRRRRACAVPRHPGQRRHGRALLGPERRLGAGRPTQRSAAGERGRAGLAPHARRDARGLHAGTVRPDPALFRAGGWQRRARAPEPLRDRLDRRRAVLPPIGSDSPAIVFGSLSPHELHAARLDGNAPALVLSAAYRAGSTTASFVLSPDGRYAAYIEEFVFSALRAPHRRQRAAARHHTTIHGRIGIPFGFDTASERVFYVSDQDTARSSSPTRPRSRPPPARPEVALSCLAPVPLEPGRAPESFPQLQVNPREPSSASGTRAKPAGVRANEARPWDSERSVVA